MRIIRKNMIPNIEVVLITLVDILYNQWPNHMDKEKWKQTMSGTKIVHILYTDVTG